MGRKMIETTSRLVPLFRVKLIEKDKSHFYQLENDEDWKPGVTTVLKMINKPALIQWASNSACENIRDYLMANALDKPLTKEQIEKACLEGKNIYKKKASDAAGIGSRVHSAIDGIIKGTAPAGAYGADIESGVKGFLEWRSSHSLTIELGDTKLGSRMFGYGGSLDMVAFNEKNEAIIFDIKTTKKRKDRDHGIYDEAAYQLGAYVQAFRETYGIEVKEVYGLWLNKEKPEFKAVKINNLQKAFEGFLAALKLYQISKYDLTQGGFNGFQ